MTPTLRWELCLSTTTEIKPGTPEVSVFPVYCFSLYILAFSSTYISFAFLFDLYIKTSVVTENTWIIYANTQKISLVLCTPFIVKYTSTRASLVAQIVKKLPAIQETQVQFLGWEVPLPTPVFLPGESIGWRSLSGYIHEVMKSWTWLSD